MGKCMVITGVAGFVGSNLAKRLLDLGYSVRGVDNLSAGTLENVDDRVEFHEADIRAPKRAAHPARGRRDPYRGPDVARPVGEWCCAGCDGSSWSSSRSRCSPSCR